MGNCLLMEKAQVSFRVLAKFIDLLLGVFLAIILRYPLGPLVGFLYTLLGDALVFSPFYGQSLGKKLVGLRVIDLTTGKSTLHWRQSFLRNLPIGVVTFFGMIPFWGWLVAIFLGFPLITLEIYFMAKNTKGQRFGDILARTQVIQIQEEEGRAQG